MAAALSAASEADGVDLIDEDDAGGVEAGGVEKAVEVALAHADVGVEDFFDADVDEGELAFTGGGSGEHRFATAGGAVEEDAAAGATAVFGIDFRFEDWQDDHFVDDFLDVIHPTDIGKGDVVCGDVEWHDFVALFFCAALGWGEEALEAVGLFLGVDFLLEVGRACEHPGGEGLV